VNNLKSIGNIAKFTLLGMWLISIILLAVFGIRQAAAHAYTGSVSTEKELAFRLPEQPIKIRLQSSRLQNNGNGIGINGVVLDYTENGEEVLVSEDIRINLKMSKDSIARLEVRKNANGNTFKNATETANNINYGYEIQGNTIILDDFLTTAKENKYRDQEVRIYLYLPVGTVLAYESDNNHCWIMSAPLDRNMSGCKMTKYLWKMDDNGELICLNCPVKEDDNDDNSNGKIIINEDGVDIDLKGDGDSFKLKIDDQRSTDQNQRDQKYRFKKGYCSVDSFNNSVIYNVAKET